MDEIEQYKRQAAERAVEQYVRSGMVVGLGHGSTALWALRHIAALLDAGELKDIVGIPCSRRVEQEAAALGIPLGDLAAHPIVDVTIDGADELDEACNLIKGGGGALLREKIVAQASRQEIIIADHTKLSPVLGTNWAVPLEVIPFGWETHLPFLRSLGGGGHLRAGPEGAPFHTDSGNLILDWHFGPIPDPAALAAQLKSRAGIVEHGLFVGLVTEAIVAGPEGVRHLRPGRI